MYTVYNILKCCFIQAQHGALQKLKYYRKKNEIEDGTRDVQCCACASCLVILRSITTLTKAKSSLKMRMKIKNSKEILLIHNVAMPSVWLAL